MSSISVAECHQRLRHGLVPAVPVTFGTSGQIDATAQARYVAYMAEQPIAGVAVWAHTGRGLLLSREQRIQVLCAWRDGLGPGKTLIAGVGGAPQHAGDARAFVHSALSMATSALENGAHTLLIYPPTPFRQSAQQDELTLDYHKRLSSLGAPLILFYLYDAAGGFPYSPGLLRNLFALPEVVGIKLATLDSVMTFQDVASVIKRDFPQKLLITGEDRFLGYSLMCGAQAALIGMAAAYTGGQHDLMEAHFQGRAAEFLTLSRLVDELAEVLFVSPMEGYIRRVLWTLVNEGIIGRESSYDPWGPELHESEFAEIGNVLRRITQ
jgi:4-hydroxy-tetrahydrodipicolinate synthase